MNKYFKLNDICDISGGYAFKSTSFRECGIPIIRIGDISDNKINISETTAYINENIEKHKKFIISKGDILIALSGATTGKFGIYDYDEPALLNQRVAKLFPKKDVLNKYLYHYMNKLQDIIYNKALGCAQPNISPREIGELEIYLPNISEQKKIVEILDKAQILIYKRKEQIKYLDELVKSKFIEMFGDPAFNPKEWNIKSFDEVFNISSSSRILKSEWKTEGTIPFYRVRDMVFLSENGVANNEFFVSEEFYESLQNEKGTPQYGDIMVSATSTIGKCYIVKPGEKFYYKDADILRFRKKVELAPEYFIHFMKTSFAVNQIERTFGITTVPHFTIVNSKKINMIYPPIELQNKFADFVKQVDKLKFAMEKSLKELENNFNSLMQKAFKGELFN